MSKTTVTVDYAGGTLNGATSGSFEMDSDANLEALLKAKGFEEVTREDYIFAGWDLPEKVNGKYAEKITVTAKWSVNGATVEFYLPGDTQPSLTQGFLIGETISYEPEEGLVISEYINKADGTLFTDFEVTQVCSLKLLVDVYNQGMTFTKKTSSDYQTTTEVGLSSSYYAASITNAALSGATKLYYPHYYDGERVEVIEDANKDASYEFFTTLKFASIPSSVKLIWSDSDNGNYTGLFHNAEALEAVVFGEDSELKEIHEPAAFYNTTSLKSITLPDTLAYFGNRTFYNSGLTGIALPAALKSLPNETFNGATGLTSFIIPEGSQLETMLTPFGNTAIPGVTALDFTPATKLTTVSSLAVFTNLASVKFPDSVTTIGTFAGSTNKNEVLTEIDLSNTSIVALPSNVFQYVTKLATVKFPSTLETLPTGAMFGTSNGVNTTTATVDLSNTKITAVPAGAFNYMTGLETVKFPSTLKTVGSLEVSGTGTGAASNRALFYNGTSAAGSVVTLDFGDAQLDAVGDYAFYNLPGLKDLSLTIAANGTMGAFVFAKSGTINTEITVEAKTDATVSGAAFTFMTVKTLNLKGFTSFGNISVSSVEALPSATTTNNGGTVATNVLNTYPAFLGSSVTKVTFDSALTELGDFAFVYSNAQPVFEDASKVTYGDYLFYQSKLTAFDFASTPFTVIGDYMFYGSENLATLANTDNFVTVGAYAFAETKVTSFNIGSKVTKIDATAFNGNGKMTFTGVDRNRYFELVLDENDNDDYILYQSSLRDDADVSIFYDYKLMDATAPFTRDFSETNLTEVGTAYANNPFLQSISFPTTVTSISAGAFINCTGLESVSFLGVTEIGNRAFYGCTSLVTLTIPATLVTIADEAFSNSALASLTAPEGSLLETVGESAFAYGSLNLLDLTNATHLKSLGVNAFANQSGTADTFTVLLPAEADEDFKTLAAGLFASCAKLKSIVIPAYITAFDSGTTGTFAKSGLTSLSFAEGSQFESFGTGALSGLNITTLSLPDSLKTIGMAAFAGMTSLEEVTIPSGVTIIAGTSGTTAAQRGAFGACTSLRKVTFLGETAVPDYTFYGCSSLADVNFENVTSVGMAAFYGTGFTSLTISSGLTLGKAAFAASTKLQTLTLPTDVTLTAGTSTTTYNYGVFGGCSNLATVTLTGDGKIAIPDYTFHGCPKIATIDFTKISTIGLAGFFGNNSLTGTLDLSGVTSIGMAAFAGDSTNAANKPVFTGVTLATDVTLTAGTSTGGTNVGVFALSASLETVQFVGEGLATIPAYTFYNCTALTSVDFNKIGTIGNDAFEYGSNTTENKLGTPDLSNVTSIGDKAFQYRTMTSALNLSSATTIGANAFYGTGLTSVDVSGAKTIGAAAFSGTPLTSVTFGSGAVELGKAAFANCTELTSVTLPAGVTFVAGTGATGTNLGAFGGCTSLTTVTLSGNTEIGAYAFHSCTALTTFSFDKVTKLNNYAFTGCSSLTSANLTALSSTATGTYIFQNCTSLASVTFGGSANLGNYAFDGCSSLATVDFDHVTNFGTYCFRNCYSLREIKIPSGMTSVSNYAFQGCASLVTVTIPSNITSIGTSAFQNCYKLAVIINQSNISITAGATTNGYIGQHAKVVVKGDTTNDVVFTTTDGNFTVLKDGTTYSVLAYNGASAAVVLPAELTLSDAGQTKVSSYKLYNYLFYYDSVITSVTIPASVTEIGNYAFQNTTKLTTVTFTGESTLTSIGTSAFMASGITAIAIPASVTSIGDTAFQNAAKLTTVTFTGTSGLKSLGKTAFAGSGITSITIPAGVTATGGTFSAGTSATTGVFSACTSLTSVTFAGTGVAVPNYTFTGCTSLGTVNFANVASVGTAAFNNTGLVNITLPSNITITAGTAAASGAFANCTLLERVTFSGTDKKATVAAYTFYGCTALNTVNFDNIATINKCAFYNTGFVNLTLPGDISYEAVTSYSNSVFGTSTLLQTVTFTGEKVAVPNYLFYGCTALDTVNFDKVATIGDGAFYNTGFASLTLGANITSIGKAAFAGCVSLGSVTYNAGTTITDGTSNSSTNYGAFGGCTSLTNVTIQGTLTKIPGYIFCNTALTQFTIPATVTEIGEGAFRGCSSLTNLSFADGSTITAISKYGFSGTGISSIALPASVTSLADYAFSDCASLASITLPAGVTSIGASAFASCALLSQININDLTGLTSVGNNAFQATAITSMTLPSTVTSLGTNVFLNCLSLEYVDLTDVQVAALGANFFKGCTSLTTVKLPKSLGADGLKANAIFSGCSALTDIWYEGDTTLNKPTATSSNKVFYNCPSFTMHVKDATLYTDNWSSQFNPTTNFITFVTIEYPDVEEPGEEGGEEGPDTDLPEADEPGKENGEE